jgi:hypothetical protein
MRDHRSHRPARSVCSRVITLTSPKSAYRHVVLGTSNLTAGWGRLGCTEAPSSKQRPAFRTGRPCLHVGYTRMCSLDGCAKSPIAIVEIEAPRVGLEPTTNGLTVPPTPSVQSEWVLCGAVLSTNSVRSSCPVSSCPATYGYTYGYTRREVRSP